MRDARGWLRLRCSQQRLPGAQRIQNSNRFPRQQRRRAEPKPVVVPEAEGGAEDEVSRFFTALLTRWGQTSVEIHRLRKVARWSGHTSDFFLRGSNTASGGFFFFFYPTVTKEKSGQLTRRQERQCSSPLRQGPAKSVGVAAPTC